MTPLPSTDGFYEIELLPSQDEELFGSDEYPLLIVIGGPGSGKTTVNSLWVERWGGICTEQPYAIFANTWDQMVNAILDGLYQTFAEMGRIEGRDYIMGKRVPKAWRQEWRRKGIRVPVERARGVKMLVLRWSGVHIYLGTYANQSWRRIKGQSIQAVIGEEITEPDVNVRDFLTYLLTRVRCGHGTACRTRGHFHRIILKGNVPLHNPSHAIYKLNSDLKAKEEQRKASGESPYYRLIEVDTRENTHMGAEYIERLMAGMDDQTFDEQISGKLVRRSQNLTYYSFSDANILPRPDWPRGLTYDPRRELHIWFDFNNVPATAGWGHDLRPGEVPLQDARAKHPLGVVGELFSDSDPMDTYRVANALIEDPTADLKFLDSRCRETECGHPMKKHISVVGSGWLCEVCAFTRDTGHGKMFCSGKTTEYEWSRKYIHATPNWRGLMKHAGPIFVYGDASGKNETSSSVLGSSLKILKDVFTENLGDRVSFRFKEGNPSITMRELAVNLGLRAADGTHSLFFAPWCDAHIEDCRQVVPDPKTGHAKKVYATAAERAKGNGYWQRTHSMDGASYMWDYRFPFEIPRAGSMPYTGEGDPLGPFDTRWTVP